MKDQWTIKLLLLLNKIEIPIIFLSVAELGHHQKVVKICFVKNPDMKKYKIETQFKKWNFPCHTLYIILLESPILIQ